MAVRKIIEIDEALCDGCGDCINACAEGAIQLIEGKAKLVRDSYCDGLGACIGDCHTGALRIVERDAEDFDEVAVNEHLVRIGRGPGEPAAPSLDLVNPTLTGGEGGCPGSRSRTLRPVPVVGGRAPMPMASQLRHWPIQLHLVPPTAPFFRGAKVLLAADCVAFAVADFHQRYLAEHSLAIACPKLDEHQEVYLDKLVTMIDAAEVQSVHVVVMEVPCCGGLVRLVEDARRRSTREIPVTCTVIGIDGEVRREMSLDRDAV
jgi:NAD-dependent dihydropyrimidine dehydrogenase PreA subunit